MTTAVAGDTEGTHVGHLARVLGTLLLLPLAAAACSAHERGGGLHKLKGPDFPFSLPDLDGRPVSSGDSRFEGKVVVFELWGTWCPPCREMTGVLEELHERYAASGLEVVGAAFEVATGGADDPRAALRDYVSKNDMRYLVLYGGAAEHPSSLVFDELPFREFDGFPTTVIIGRDGKVVGLEEDFDRGTARRLEATVRHLLHPSS